jgi:hypothetical protein
VTVEAGALTVTVEVEGGIPKQLQAELYRAAPEHAEAYVGMVWAVRLFTMRVVVVVTESVSNDVTSVVIVVRRVVRLVVVDTSISDTVVETVLVSQWEQNSNA